MSVKDLRRASIQSSISKSVWLPLIVLVIGYLYATEVGKSYEAQRGQLITDALERRLAQISEAVNDKYINLELDYKYNEEDDPNRYYYRSDHYNFAKNNIPVIFYFNGVHADYHKPSDTIDKIHFPKVEKISRYIFLTAWELANRDERPKLNID